MNDTPGSIDGRIRFAIEDKRLIKVGYDGAVRIVEPHDYVGLNQVDRLFVFQLHGRESSKSSTPWRSLDVPKIESLEILDETFPGSRATEAQHHHVWDVV